MKRVLITSTVLGIIGLVETFGLLYIVKQYTHLSAGVIQSIIFLLPHLLLLTISMQLWPIVLAQFFAGWIYGWLFYKSESILPGWLAHSLGNAFGAMMFMR